MNHLRRIVVLTFITVLISACTSGVPSFPTTPSGGVADQGSIASPVAIGSFPVTNFSGTVDAWGFFGGESYYRVDGISPGGSYTVSLTGTTNNVQLDVYDSGDFFTDLICFDFDFDIVGDRTCSTYGSGTGTSLYIKVSADMDNTSVSNFNISVQ